MLSQQVVGAGSALEQALREISQRRRSGVLSVLSAGRTIEVGCVQGRIVDVREAEVNVVSELYDRLVAAEFPLPDLLEVTPQSYEGILRDLIKANGVSETEMREQLRRVIRASIEAKLCHLLGTPSEVLGFAPAMIAFDHAWAPAIPVAPFLLDWVEFCSNEPQFQQLFPPGQTIHRASLTAAPEFSVAERALVTLLAEPCPVETLYLRACLGPMEFQSALLALRAAGIVKGHSAAASTAETAPVAPEPVSVAPAAVVDARVEAAPCVLGEAGAVAATVKAEPAPVVAQQLAYREWLTDTRLRLQSSRIVEGALIWIVAAAACTIPWIAWEPFIGSVLGR